MKPFMVVSVYERFVDSPKFFISYAEAFDYMMNDLLRISGMTREDTSILLEEGSNEEFGITDSEAWCTRRGVMYDWKIFYISKDVAENA